MKRQFSVESLEPDEARSALSAQKQGDVQMFVIWPADTMGFKLYYADFVRYFDDLWRPSSDDIWVVTSDFKWLLELDHEETVTVFESAGEH